MMIARRVSTAERLPRKDPIVAACLQDGCDKYLFKVLASGASIKRSIGACPLRQCRWQDALHMLTASSCMEDQATDVLALNTVRCMNTFKHACRAGVVCSCISLSKLLVVRV